MGQTKKVNRKPNKKLYLKRLMTGSGKANSERYIQIKRCLRVTIEEYAKKINITISPGMTDKQLIATINKFANKNGIAYTKLNPELLTSVEILKHVDLSINKHVDLSVDTIMFNATHCIELEPEDLLNVGLPEILTTEFNILARMYDSRMKHYRIETIHEYYHSYIANVDVSRLNDAELKYKNSMKLFKGSFTETFIDQDFLNMIDELKMFGVLQITGIAIQINYDLLPDDYDFTIIDEEIIIT